jgi:hypothetical protein
MTNNRYSCQILIKANFLDRVSKNSQKQISESPSSGSLVVPCGHTDMKKLTVTFRNFANAPKKLTKEIYTVLYEPML